MTNSLNCKQCTNGVNAMGDECYFCDGLGILDDSTPCDNCAGTGENLDDC